MIHNYFDGVTIQLPTMALINNSIITTSTQFDYKTLIENYFNEFYFDVKILGGKIILEQLQVNYNLTSLFRSIRYLDQSPLVSQSQADKIANILNFEQDYNVNTNHAIELKISNLDSIIRNRLLFYNFGLTNNQIDLITPYLTVNDVDISGLGGGLKFDILTPSNLQFGTKNYFTLFGCFLLKGKIYASGIK